MFDVYVDGEKVGESIDLYTPGADTSFKIPVAATELPYGKHTVTVTIVGKNAKSVGYNMYIDAVDIRGVFVVPDAGALVDDEVLIGTSKATQFDVLFNDDVPEGTTVTEYTQPIKGSGTVELVDGLFVYTPTTIDLSGDSFTYTAAGNTATIYLNYAETVRYEETFQSDDLVFGRVEEETPKAAKWAGYKLAAYSGGSAKRSSQAGDTVTITFYGTGVDVIGYLSKTRGQFKVTLDDEVVSEEESCYDNSYDKFYNTSIYMVDGLEKAQHTLTIEVLNKRAKGSLGTAIDIDAFVVNK